MNHQHDIRKWIGLCETEGDDDPNPVAMVNAFEDAFDTSGLSGKVTVSLQIDPDNSDTTVELNHISTLASERGNGLANRAMMLLTDLADRYAVVLRLGVAMDADGRNNSLTREELIDWYARWGFEGGEVMRRWPEEPR